MINFVEKPFKSVKANVTAYNLQFSVLSFATFPNQIFFINYHNKFHAADLQPLTFLCQ